MPAWKALVFVVILGLVVAAGLFFFVPASRPGFLQSWVRQAKGLGPAKTPKDALDRFQKALKNRDYDSAATFCTADYAGQMRKAAKGANSLGTAVDGLMYHLEGDAAKINSPESKAVIRSLDPFPSNFTYTLRHKDGEPTAFAAIVFEPLPPAQKTYGLDPRILFSLVPDWVGEVPLKLEGDKDKVWKIDFPATTLVGEKVDYLKENHGNYKRALDNLKDAVTRDSAAKADFESQLSSELQKAK